MIQNIEFPGHKARPVNITAIANKSACIFSLCFIVLLFVVK